MKKVKRGQINTPRIISSSTRPREPVLPTLHMNSQSKRNYLSTSQAEVTILNSLSDRCQNPSLKDISLKHQKSQHESKKDLVSLYSRMKILLEQYRQKEMMWKVEKKELMNQVSVYRRKLGNSPTLTTSTRNSHQLII